MTWTPSQRILRAEIPRSFQVRGIYAPMWLCWPGVFLNGSADYSVDFSHLLGCSDRIVAVEAVCSGGVIAWVSMFGVLASIWVQWLCPGLQTATISVRTAEGAVFTATASIMVSCAPQLITADVLDYAPNTFLLSSAIVPDAFGNPLIFG